jgi:hypothetical protein
MTLREIGCGQVDLCTYKNGRLNLFEVKNSPEGLTRSQWSRLSRSLAFLTAAFNAEGKIHLVKNLPKY